MYTTERDSEYQSLALGYEGLVSVYDMLLGQTNTLFAEVTEALKAVDAGVKQPTYVNEFFLGRAMGWFDGLNKRYDDQPQKDSQQRERLDRNRAELLEKWKSETEQHRQALECQIQAVPGARQVLRQRLDELKPKLDELKRKLDAMNQASDK